MRGPCFSWRLQTARMGQCMQRPGQPQECRLHPQQFHGGSLSLGRIGTAKLALFNCKRDRQGTRERKKPSKPMENRGVTRPRDALGIDRVRDRGERARLGESFGLFSRTQMYHSCPYTLAYPDPVCKLSSEGSPSFATERCGQGLPSSEAKQPGTRTSGENKQRAEDGAVRFAFQRGSEPLSV
ncbi:hypothetical protein TGP89_361770 [Toxoplasma gondii p89]|uniref:Uncharacterized protein n=1 Tax=Toxoplasma gondii p89 TaxID=943119 RepID=A0A086JEJ0_TOXGO|nr:hypothetical protein TGP89_361770 [Toxoplasma gondii p89]